MRPNLVGMILWKRRFRLILMKQCTQREGTKLDYKKDIKWLVNKNVFCLKLAIEVLHLLYSILMKYSYVKVTLTSNSSVYSFFCTVSDHFILICSHGAHDLSSHHVLSHLKLQVIFKIKVDIWYNIVIDMLISTSHI